MPAKTAAAKKRKAKSKVKPSKAAKTAKKTRPAKAKKSAATKRAKTAVKKSPKKSPKKSAKKPAKSAKSAKPSKTAKPKRKAVKKSAAKGRKVKPKKAGKVAKPIKKKPAKKKPAKTTKPVKRTAKKIKPKAAPAKAAARSRPRPVAKSAKKLSGGGRAYRPTIKEDYMCKRQRDYFDDVLLRMLNQVSVTAGKTIDAMREAEEALSDENDRASKEAEFVLELREREREGHLARKIRHARQRLRNGEFGLCEECGDNIGLQRLLARPVATLCFECKNLQEYKEKIHS